jgi:ribosomal protein S18 acetylase RimI-like enzyme
MNESSERPQFYLEEAKPEDARNIYGVAVKTWVHTYQNESIGLTTEMIERHFDNLDERVLWLENYLRNGIEKMWVIKSGEDIIGYCSVKSGETENEIRTLYVLPEYQKQGLGDMLMTNALGYFGIDKNIAVEVADYNANAIDFYKRYGFEISEDQEGEKLVPIGGVNVTVKKMTLPAIVDKTD